MNEIVTINEVRNDGRSIHLYYNGLMGLSGGGDQYSTS